MANTPPPTPLTTVPTTQTGEIAAASTVTTHEPLVETNYAPPAEISEAITQQAQEVTQKVADNHALIRDFLKTNEVIGPWLNLEVAGNTVYHWLLFVLIFLLLKWLLRLVRTLLIRQLPKLLHKMVVSDPLNWLAFMAQCLQKMHSLFFMLIALSLASHALQLPPNLAKLMMALPSLALFFQAGLWVSPLLTHVLDGMVAKQASEGDAANHSTLRMMLGPLRFVGLLVAWSILLLLAMANVGVNVTALVAGLGVGGIAVALAVQNVLGDIFAAFSIVIDKPFVLGDFIIVGDFLGSVEHIGLKTTRIRSLGGEQIIFSNTDLLSSRIRNYKRMEERRIVFKFGLLYQTPPDLITQVVEAVKEIITAQPLAKMDRVHFLAFGTSSLDFEAVYYVASPEYNDYMDTQQAINLAMMHRFNELGVEFAYPTQTLYVHPQPTTEAKD
jgi:small-conductance mechanosensitive channel